MKQNPAFTDLFLRKLASPASGRAEYYDGKVPGFGVRVTAAGTKTFFVVHRHEGAFRRLSLGRYSAVSLQAARQQAQQALGIVAKGEDPQASRRSHKATKSNLFSDVVTQFVESHCQRRNRQSTAYETTRLLQAVFVPVWQRKPVAEIPRADVLSVIDGIEAAGTPAAARHAFAAIRKFFNWCVERGLIAQSPCLTLKAPGRPVARERVLSDGELTNVLQGTAAIGWPFGPIVELLILTAQRRGEVVGMQWSEIDMNEKLWTIPGSRTKNHRMHSVPLSDSVIILIENLPRHVDSPFVFPARGKPDQAYSGYSKGKRALNALCSTTDWTLHDLRRTSATCAFR
ncbi:MAG: integrase arm-type DNA-binding domain-containing protein [Alphaproteobacteria bacterium]|nr:integrase arm-type DNA-binding domain-containing protein [Alphaproteobacteria bacterium]